MKNTSILMCPRRRACLLLAGFLAGCSEEGTPSKSAAAGSRQGLDAVAAGFRRRSRQAGIVAQATIVEAAAKKPDAARPSCGQDRCQNRCQGR